MNSGILIRAETDADVGAIRDVTVAAFRDLAISDHTEQFVIDALRAARALTISLVAELDGRVVGHVAFSPVSLSDGTPGWYGLGSLSVPPGRQGQDIGKALVEAGLERLNEKIKRRTRLVRIFPNAESCPRLVRALCVETHEARLGDCRHLNMSLLAEQKKELLSAAA